MNLYLETAISYLVNVIFVVLFCCIQSKLHYKISNRFGPASGSNSTREINTHTQIHTQIKHTIIHTLILILDHEETCEAYEAIQCSECKYQSALGPHENYDPSSLILRGDLYLAVGRILALNFVNLEP